MKNKLKYRVEKLTVHKDERGWLVELFRTGKGVKPVKQIHVASIRPGYIRGEHYHSKRIERFFIVAGRAELILQDIKTKAKVAFRLSPKEPKVITIFPYVGHSVKNIGKEMVYLASAQNDIYDPKNQDKFPWRIY